MQQKTNDTPDAPIELQKIKNGFQQVLDQREIYEYNFPNYNRTDILLDSLTLSFSQYDPKINGNTFVLLGLLNIKDSSYPESDWDHMSGTIYIAAITQAGKTAQNISSTIPGAGLRKLKSNIIDIAPLENISINTEGKIIKKHGGLWSFATWNFKYKDKSIANFETVALGISRDYSALSTKRGIRV